MKDRIWIAQQTWSNIYFIHYPLDQKKIKYFLPRPLKLANYEGQAWLSLVVFQARYSRPRFFHKRLAYPPFWQINLRTYIEVEGRKSVYFFHLFCNDMMAARLGQSLGLPYLYSPFQIRREEGAILLKNKKALDSPLIKAFNFSLFPCKGEAALDPSLSPLADHEGKIDEWLTDVDRITFINPKGLLERGVRHQAWQLDQAQGEVTLSGPIEGLIEGEDVSPRIIRARSLEAQLSTSKMIGLIKD